MGHLDYKHFARRHRPHIHPVGAVLFLTYRLAGTVPKETLRFYKANGEWLRKEVDRIIEEVANSDDHYDPNGRLVVTADHPSLARIMQSLKRRSARSCNQLLGRRGQFWEHENFDRVIRADKFDSTIRYVLNNPVKAGLVDHWQGWRWNYLRDDLVTKL